MNKSFGSLMIVLLLAGWAQGAPAQSITNGYVCAPKNIGGEETRLFFRQQDGVAINLSSSATFPVVCPVIINYGDPFYEVVVRVGNGSNITQNIACALEEYDNGNNIVRSIGKSQLVPPNIVAALGWTSVILASDGNTLSLRCILPPRGTIGGVGWY